MSSRTRTNATPVSAAYTLERLLYRLSTSKHRESFVLKGAMLMRHWLDETFAPTDTFKPSRPFQTRIKWRDPGGDEQSKLLLTAPETVIAELVKAKKLQRLTRRPAGRPTKSPNGSTGAEALRR